ncbi:MAG: ABC transporter ATP-binding protein [Caldilineaceae bacterium SB0661_bin_32]|uniref:ABC transporter ATP-binding protein n=1 Tax=Caldilineaceae bacterium SB0661_bin_32 TaxID=2605255 RepID=A0A6B1D1M0_9CHLR|nr:ABC transporter ATP-binding protein [Caldilineaceae bacterium SB0661_bin_32]
MNITVDDLTKVYRSRFFRTDTVALDHLSLTIEMGMFGLLGPNGAGKTTLMRVLATLLPPTSGAAYVGDWKVDDPNEKWCIRAQLGYLPQELQMYDNLSAREFLAFIAGLKRVPAEEQGHQIGRMLELTGLSDMAGRLIRTYSGGMKRRLGVAQALIGNPKVVIVDEPTAGLDPQERVRFRNLLVELAQERLVLLSSHITEDIAQTCSRLAVLDHGQLRFHGGIQTLLQTTAGRVWAFTTVERSVQEREDLRVVAITHTEQGTHYRVLAEEKPTIDAVSVPPTVEDAYLWLIQPRNS